MPKRISLKGKGANIFFGDESSDTPTEELSDTNATPALNNSPSSDICMQESMHASMHARNKTMRSRNQPPASPLTADMLNAIWQHISERATITNAFRYTDQELSWLTDALYEITKHHGVKLTKQDIARLGLNVILWDYRVHGDTSLLGEFVLRKKRQRGEEL